MKYMKKIKTNFFILKRKINFYAKIVLKKFLKMKFLMLLNYLKIIMIIKKKKIKIKFVILY